MRRKRQQAGVLQGALACAVSLGLMGCEGTSVLKTASLPMSVSLGNYSSSNSEGTQEIYSRVARGAKACWFGPGKPLEKTHVFEGELAPDSEGGAAEVAVHIRTPDQPSPRGGKVFIVSITREGGGSSLVTEHRQISETLAHAMRADVARWAKSGSAECSTLALSEGQVAASDAPPLPERKPVAKRAKAKDKKQ